MAIRSSNPNPISVRLAGVVAALVVAFILVNLSCITIDTGTVGVVTRFGKVTGRTLEPGFNWISPIDTVSVYDCRIQRQEYQTECFSKDLQTVDVSLTVLHSIDKTNAINIHSTIGPAYFMQALPKISEVLKQSIAKYQAEEIIDMRDSIRREVLSSAIERTSAIVHLEDIILTNIDFTDAYEKAIEQKQVAQQESLKAKYELEKAKVEAEKAIEIARGEAEAIKIKGESLENNPMVVSLSAIEKWDGKAPNALYIGNNAALPVVVPAQ